MPPSSLTDTITPHQTVSVSDSPMFPSVQTDVLGQDPPPSDGPRFTLHQKVKSSRDRSETVYTCWIVEVFYGTNGVPVTYRIRFSKMKVSDDEIFTETVIETHPHPGLTVVLIPLSLLFAYLNL